MNDPPSSFNFIFSDIPLRCPEKEHSESSLQIEGIICNGSYSVKFDGAAPFCPHLPGYHLNTFSPLAPTSDPDERTGFFFWSLSSFSES